MKLLVTGVSGLVGSAVARAADSSGHHVVGLVGRHSGAIAGVAEQISVELHDEAATRQVIRAAAPDAIINCAAVSSPDACDANPALAKAVNVRLPAVLAGLAEDSGARFVHISSEQVFDGQKTEPYAATDPTGPLNLYGWQKLESEQLVHGIAPQSAVTVRAPLLMGNSVTGKRAVHERLLADWAAGRVPQLYADELRQPCTGGNLAAVLLELCIVRNLRGVYHWAGTELISRHALGVRIREWFKLGPEIAPLAAITRADTPGAESKRQPCLALDITPLASVLKTRPQSIAEQLAQLEVQPACAAWYASARR